MHATGVITGPGGGAGPVGVRPTRRCYSQRERHIRDSVPEARISTLRPAEWSLQWVTERRECGMARDAPSGPCLNDTPSSHSLSSRERIYMQPHRLFDGY
ncbi:hypothetical protein GCM10018962_53980 [Dactylosporangium matsuzakiense]|uniref:Uncharacterized protein n=1 Tax=Dactylosporangium matsuzakiense TaxID=53360 RepID=A0A9W6NR00_9ACTN|nr:hypothetical protein GCM10017581_074140 [Dactylosporangium matsuzakiense]